MAGQPGFFDVEERLKQLSAKGDSLERLNAVVDFDQFRADLEWAVPRSDRSKGGRPPFDHVLMFKVLILQANHNLSDERTEYLIRDRLSFMRFLGLGLADTVPDANTIWTFCEALTRARIVGKPAIEVLFDRFDAALAAVGFLAMSGHGRTSQPNSRNHSALRWKNRMGLLIAPDGPFELIAGPELQNSTLGRAGEGHPVSPVWSQPWTCWTMSSTTSRALGTAVLFGCMLMAFCRARPLSRHRLTTFGR
jgi:hypothetical protein